MAQWIVFDNRIICPETLSELNFYEGGPISGPNVWSVFFVSHVTEPHSIIEKKFDDKMEAVAYYEKIARILLKNETFIASWI